MMGAKIALIGGAFDPPHNGHILSVSNILNSGLVDQVWLAPSGPGRYDKAAVATSAARVSMLQMVIANEFPGSSSKVRIESIQVDSPEDKCFTVDLLDGLRKRHVDKEFWIAIGADNIERVFEWHEADRLIKQCRFIVLPRAGENFSAFSPRVKNLNCDFLDSDRVISSDVSSSAIRSLFAEGKSVAGMLPAYLVDFLERNDIYRSDQTD